MGWNVYTMAEEGSVDLPIALHRFFDAEHPPPYPLPANKTRTVFRTATTPSKALAKPLGIGLGTMIFPNPDPTGGFGANEIRFEDKMGCEEMFWNTSKDHKILVQNDKIEQIRANHKRQVVNDHSLDVKVNSQDTIVGNQTIHIMGNQKEIVGANREKTVKGDEQNDIGVSRKVTTGVNHDVKIKGDRELTVGTTQLDICLGDIVAIAPSVHTLVGGVAVKVTANNMTETVGKTLSFGGITGPAVGGVLQTIGGAKIELAKGKRAISVGKSYMENVGGMSAQLAQQDVTDEAENAQNITTGGLLLAYGGQGVICEGTTQVLLQCGASSILLNAAGVTITSTKVTVSGGSLLELSAALVEHN